jgi:hypothetical protein
VVKTAISICSDILEFMLLNIPNPKMVYSVTFGITPFLCFLFVVAALKLAFVGL